MKHIILVILLMFTLPAMAAQVTTTGLTDAQHAQMELQVAQFKASNANDPFVSVSDTLADVDNISRYAQLGEGIAKSIGATAKELGVATNEFMASPAGFVATVLIVYHFVGADFVTFMIGMFMIFPITLIVIGRVVKFIRYKDTTTETVKRWYGEKTVRTDNYISWKDMDANHNSMYVLTYIVSMFVILIELANFLP